MTTWTIGSDGWVDGSIFGFKVEHEEVPRPGGQAYLRLTESSKLANLHTSEGLTMDGLIATLRSKQFAGQWCVGQGRIVQTRPVWAQGSLLLGGDATNKPCRMEVEQVAFTKSTLWQPEPPTFGPMAALAAFYAVEFGVPLKTPIASWKDDGSDVSPGFFGPNNRRTQTAAAGMGNLQGWIHHCEVPQNLHADCGAYNRTALYAAAQKLVDSLNPPEEDDMTPEQAAQLANVDDFATKVNRENLAGLLRGINDGNASPDHPSDALKAGGLGPFEKAGWYIGSEAQKAVAAIPSAPDVDEGHPV